MTTEEKIERLTGVVESLAASVVAHDNQIEKLIVIAEKHATESAEQKEEIRQLVREWQAYLRTIRPQ
jgi:hypothetical protein